MTPPPQLHGTHIRGFTLGASSKLFQGQFGRLFRTLLPADYGDNDEESISVLTNLGAEMCADKDSPKDGPDPEESGIPAAYTYLGQFIDHDLTFDPASSLQRQNDPDGLVDFRTPRFDLDSVYGRGPDDQPYLYSDGSRFLLGTPMTGSALGAPIQAHDLPRSRAKEVDPAAQARAIIGDPRNDENVIVSQLQGLFLRLHNRFVDDGLSFDQAQRQVRFHYQWMVLHDFLPTIISSGVLTSILPHVAKGSNTLLDPPQLELYHPPRESAFMPLEFSAAAYRFGHSMVRPGYRLNDQVPPLPIFPFASAPKDPALTGFDSFPDTWAIDWGRFLDLSPRPFGDENNEQDPGNPQRTQLAYKIDTSLVNPLSDLSPRVATNPPNLASRNLLRGFRMRLPNGQDVARAMGVEPLADSEILVGKFSGQDGDIKGNIVQVGGDAFKGNCPLWTYVLAETEEVVIQFKTTEGEKPITTRLLGPVGGRIVAETIVGLLAFDSSSYLNQNPLWRPSLAVNGIFGLRELVQAATRA